MQLVRTAALIARLKAYLETTNTTQVALARELGLSPQNTSLILRGTNCPNSETTLQIALEILKENQMNDAPKTLHLARERISEMAEEIKRLKSMMATAAAPAVPAPPLPAKPAVPLPAAATNDRNTGMIYNPVPADLSPIEALRVQLTGTTDPAGRIALFEQIKALQEEQRMPATRARLRGA